MTSIRVDGADRLARTMRDAGGQLADMTATHQAVATSIAATVTPPRKSGRLAASITGDGEPNVAVIYSTVVYAPVQEFGWPARNIAARSFMARAAGRAESGAIRRYAAAVSDTVAGIRGI